MCAVVVKPSVIGITYLYKRVLRSIRPPSSFVFYFTQLNKHEYISRIVSSFLEYTHIKSNALVMHVAKSPHIHVILRSSQRFSLYMPPASDSTCAHNFRWSGSRPTHTHNTFWSAFNGLSPSRHFSSATRLVYCIFFFLFLVQQCAERVCVGTAELYKSMSTPGGQWAQSVLVLLWWWVIKHELHKERKKEVSGFSLIGNQRKSVYSVCMRTLYRVYDSPFASQRNFITRAPIRVVSPSRHLLYQWSGLFACCAHI